jgi:hypothetical protein
MKQKFANALSLALIVAMLFTSAALASEVTVAVVDVSVPLDAVTLAPGASGNITINLSVTGNQVGTATFEVYRNWTLSGGTFTGSNPQEFTVAPRGGSDPATTFSTTGTVTVAAGHASGGPFTVTIGVFDITNTNTTGAKLAAGQSDTYSVTVSAPPPPSDTTAPVITPNVSGTLGNNGWYVSDVTLSWSVVDNESAISSSSGCGSTTINADTADTTLTCSATSAGGTSSQSVTIKRDATQPGITFVSPSTLAWYNADVTANWSCSDATSGPVNTSVNGLASGEGLAVAATGTCVDNAGNSASNTQYFQIDQTLPTISGSASPEANEAGWNNTDVDVSFVCDDALSGITSCGPDQTLTSDGAGQSVTGNATDNASNTASATVSDINIDKTAPTATASASPAANGFGWNNSSVTVSYNGTDALSGIDFCDADDVLSSEGAGQLASGTCTDEAGNVSSPATATVNIDLTNPLVSLVGGPANGGTYYFGFVPAAPTCSASDALSGLNGSCSVSGYSNAVGTHSVSTSAADKAGNSNSASATYTVSAWTLNGFYQPVDMNNVMNTVRGGSTVPLKFEVFAGPTELTVTSVVQSFVQTRITCDTSATIDEIEVTSTGGTSLRYDATGGQFIQNWQTPRQAGACYRVTMTTQDGSSLVALFKLK